VLLLSRRGGYRLGAAGRVKQFEEFSLGEENNVSFSVELLKLKNEHAKEPEKYLLLDLLIKSKNLEI